MLRGLARRSSGGQASRHEDGDRVRVAPDQLGAAPAPHRSPGESREARVRPFQLEFRAVSDLAPLFSISKSTRKEEYMSFDHALFGCVVEDGSRFCHWGGRRLSQIVARVARISPHDRVLDLCCGEGGLADYLGHAQAVLGVDISPSAIHAAQKSAHHPNTRFVIADACTLPVRGGSFSRILSQDADVWMQEDKHTPMAEVARVASVDSLCVWQNYVRAPGSMTSRERDALLAVGYDVCHMPEVGQMISLFEEHGFRVERTRSLHAVYEHDTKCMLARARRLQERNPRASIAHLVALFELEMELFAQGLWTGTLIVASKAVP